MAALRGVFSLPVFTYPLISPNTKDFMKGKKNVRQDTRKMADSLRGLEQDILSSLPPASRGSDSNTPDDSSSDRNVLPDLDRTSRCLSRPIDCSVAGRLHSYSYSWSDPGELPNPHSCGGLQFVPLAWNRDGHRGYPGQSDYLQSVSISGLAKALEMAAPRAMGPECTLQQLHCERAEHIDRHLYKYTGVGPGQTEPVLCVVCVNGAQQRYSRHTIPSSTVNRCDLIVNCQRIYYNCLEQLEFYLKEIKNGDDRVREPVYGVQQERCEQLESVRRAGGVGPGSGMERVHMSELGAHLPVGSPIDRGSACAASADLHHTDGHPSGDAGDGRVSDGPPPDWPDLDQLPF